MTDRNASTTWEGTLFEGKGQVTLESSGNGTFDVSWPARAEQPDGRTSPEELLAAAHSSCFSMALSKQVADAGGTPQRLETRSTITLVPGTGITRVALAVRGAVEGLDADGFRQAAERAKDGCPVSKLFAGGSAEIVLEDASLA